MNDLPPSPPKTRAPRFRRTAASLAVLLHLSLASAWLHPIPTYGADLAASLSVLWAMLALPMAAVFVIRRCPSGVAWTCLAGVIAWGSLWRTPRLDAAPASTPRSEVVSIFVFNGSSSKLARPDSALALIQQLNPDVIVLIEPSRTLLDLVRADEWLTESHPYRRLPGSAGSGWRVVLTRWPQRAGENFAEGAPDAAQGGMHVMIVDRPEGAFGLVQVNPESPRTLARWRAGNARLDAAISAVKDRLTPLGVPVIVAGDLNASPTDARSARLAHRAGLSRAKPRFTMDGTFPAGLPAPLRMPIDDVFASPSVRLVEWRVLGSCGSDHRALLVRLRMP